VTGRVEEAKWRLVGFTGTGIINLIFRTMKIKIKGFEAVQELIKSKRFVFAFWHSRILMVSFLYQGWGAAIMVSQSRDGEVIARILSRQRHRIIRGSTTRGGVRALAKMIRILKKDGCSGAVIPDGPQGPRCQVQPGVITLGKKTGHAIIPVTYSARRIKVFSSWDRFILPRPFTKGMFVYGKPLWVSKLTTSDKEDELRIQLENELNRITRLADNYYGHRTL